MKLHRIIQHWHSWSRKTVKPALRAAMNIRVEPFWIPKHGNTNEEYEDAVWPREPREYHECYVRLAVADGATESSYARRWAEVLVKAVGEARLSAQCLLDGIDALRAEWFQILSGKALPWYAEEKVRQGAFAALVALELTTQESSGGSEGSWYAAALGDSCLFHIRGEEVLARFPMDNSAAFSNRPFLLGSVQADGECLADRIGYRHGSWTKGDRFYLMTDALACWFLHEIEGGGSPGTMLRVRTASNDSVPFPTWIASLRERGVLRNDDCTLLIVEVR